MATEISLAGWILGSDNSFIVDILPLKTVSHLKDAIKMVEEPVLNHITAHQLKI